MNCKIISSENFRKEAKRLSKKFKSLKEDLLILESELQENPFLGTPIGNNCFKIRLSIKSKGRGKRSGARVITFIANVFKRNESLTLINLLAIYDKSELGSISDLKLKTIIQDIKDSLKT